MKKIKMLIAALMIAVVTSSPTMAALDLTTFDMGDGMTNVETVFMAILGGLVTLWGLRKIVKVINRS